MASESPTELSGGKFRKRVPKACDHCRKRKIKCGPVNPITGTCENCNKFNTSCTFRHHDEISRHRKFTDLKRASDNEPKVKKAAAELSPETSSMEQKLEKLESQLAGLYELISRQQAVKSESLHYTRSQRTSGTPDMSPAPKQKRYFTSLLTKRRVAWLRKQAETFRISGGVELGDESSNWSLCPLTDVFFIASRWYVAQIKKIIDFSNPFNPLNTPQLYAFPPEHQVDSILSVYRDRILDTGFSIVCGEEVQTLLNRYFSNEKLSHSELMLLDMTFCIGICYSHLGTSSVPTETSQEFSALGSHMLLNAMYQYHKVSLLSEGLRSIQALLMLFQQVNSKISNEVAYNIFCIAQRFAQDMGLNRREAYQGLSFKEASKRLRIWYSCLMIDAQLSLVFCREPLINMDDTNIFTEGFYLKFIEDHSLCKENLTTPKNLTTALALLMDTSATFPIGAFYYGTALSRIFRKTYKYLLSANAMINVTFDEVIERVLEIKCELTEWGTSLPPALTVDQFEMRIGKLKDVAGNGLSDAGLDILRTDVLSLHYEHLYLDLLVSQLSCSFIFDNEDIQSESRYNIAALRKIYSKSACDDAFQIIYLWRKVKLVPYMLHRLFYTFNTGILTLLITSVAFPDRERTAECIELMCEIFQHLNDAANIPLLKDNIKWNVSMFIYTFVLSFAINCFNASNARAKDHNFDSTPLRDNLKHWMMQAKHNKDVAINELREHLKVFAPDVASSLDVPEQVSNECLESGKRLPRMFYLFSEVDEEDLRCLMTSLPVHHSSFDNFASTPAANKVSPSKTVSAASNYVPTTETDLIGTFSLDLPGAATPSNLISELPPDQIDFDNMLDDMLFDRDFHFPF